MMDKMYKQLPFPYFKIDERFMIISSSLSYENISFYDLLVPHLKYTFSQLIGEREKITLDLDLNNQIRSYIVYIVRTEQKQLHLFCFPNEHQDVQINKIAASMAHEIRNPLTAVKGFLQLVRPQLIESGKETYADVAIREINRANDLISEFLHTGKPVAREKKAVVLNEIAEEIYLLFENKAQLQNVSTQLATIGEEVAVYGNEQQLKQVLLNICNNALEAMDKKKGLISISIGADERNARMVIKDNGAGMSAETVKMLFSLYYSTKTTGTGLGLSISKEIIERHNGHLTINSIEGEGTAVTIELPLLNKISAN
ncbi:ATP-binding protein [Cytobacillus gottheilii]|uniref:histidine kinase n=1 Tax=Cytobacillus gottheilii TaxID=859144 RepID=A0ABX8F5S8_9BACI|nr:ATP-binding protein [Cytobacillus gottheilii]QVY59714.1 ATP-binding protein [Cytobacillus gottheilii]